MNFGETEALRKMNQERNNAYRTELSMMKETSNTNIQFAFSDEVGAAMPSDFSTRARVHYAKALKKHPFFAYKLFDNDVLDDAEYRLKCARNKVAYHAKNGWLDGATLAACEITEAEVAHLKDDKSACVDELYDAVAVLMRMIAVVEGRQKLGGEE